MKLSHKTCPVINNFKKPCYPGFVSVTYVQVFTPSNETNKSHISKKKKKKTDIHPSE